MANIFFTLSGERKLWNNKKKTSESLFNCNLHFFSKYPHKSKYSKGAAVIRGLADLIKLLSLVDRQETWPQQGSCQLKRRKDCKTEVNQLCFISGVSPNKMRRL
ncbi:hypothetical protein XENORESO_006932 [Xenotaenia resolanae]|uniref:Uncharacterized protein n=1 Tax=Xenotaenia resolanae TaxID=208358 RepID=A0ABV0X1A1_9TELE